ncbi:MAG TPA: RHS repeat-associated core domain-containing protein [Frankiaceae bacterium]|nr:RHS repeat-associated core domain-containing protein [Frankiaceae bacterium]
MLRRFALLVAATVTGTLIAPVAPAAAEPRPVGEVVAAPVAKTPKGPRATASPNVPPQAKGVPTALPAPPAEPPAPADDSVGIRPNDDPRWPVIADGGRVVVRFGNARERLVEIAMPEGRAVLQAKSRLKIGNPVIDGNGVVFYEVAPDTDLRFDVGPAGVTQRLVLRSARALHAVEIFVSDPDGALTGLTETHDGHDLGSGEQQRLSVTPAYAYEERRGAHGHVKDPRSASQTVVQEDGGYVVRSSVDRRWATRHRYPIVLDPDYSSGNIYTTSGGRFTPVTPARTLNTVTGTGLSSAQKVPSLGSLSFDVTGRAGIPQNYVSAVMVDVHPVTPGGSGSLTLYPAGVTRPAVSSVNFLTNQSISNTVIVKVGTSGQITVYNSSSVAMDVQIDVQGWFSTLNDSIESGGVLRLVEPSRILDTRWTNGGGSVGAGGTRDVMVANEGDLPAASEMSSVVVSIVTVPTEKTALTVYAKGTSRPTTPTSIETSSAMSQLVVSKVGTSGEIVVHNSAGTLDFLVDVVGYFTPLGSSTGFAPYHPLNGARIGDTRSGLNVVGGTTGAIPSNTTRDFTVLGKGGVPSSDVGVVALVVHTLNSSASGSIIVYDADAAQPSGVTSVRTIAAQTRHNLVFVKPSSLGRIRVRTVNLSTDVLVDVVGYFDEPREAPEVTWKIVEAQPTFGYAAGSTLTVELTVTNRDPDDAIDFSTSFPVPGTATPGLNGLVDDVPCVAPVTCGRSGTFSDEFAFGDVPIPAGGTKTLLAPLRVLSTRGCIESTLHGSTADVHATYADGADFFTTVPSDLTYTVCDGGLGMESWWSYHEHATGPGGRIAVNIANGNAVVQQLDSTPMRVRGDLSLVARRTYNSQDVGVTTLPGEIGKGWILNLGEVSAMAGASSVVGSGVLVPEHESPVVHGSITLIDRDGTRHSFSPRHVKHTLRVKSTTSFEWSGPDQLRMLAPVAIAIPSGSTDICVDQAYLAPAGVHLSMWRYIAVNGGTSTTPCASASAIAAGTVVGYATLRPDRFRSEFDATGRLVSMVDGAGNGLGYSHSAVTGLTVTESRPGMSARKMTLSTAVPIVPVPGQTHDCGASATAVMTLTDAAKRETKYCQTLHAANASTYLTRVVNPDGSKIDYRYSTVARADGGTAVDCGTAGRLCEVTDALDHATALTYTTASPGYGISAGPPQVASVTDRRLKATTYDYAYDEQVQHVSVDRSDKKADGTTRSTTRVRYSSIDSVGSVWQIDEGTPNATTGIDALRSTSFQWGYCTSLTMNTRPNVLCTRTRKALNPATAATQGSEYSPDEVAEFSYTPEGGLTRRRAGTNYGVATGKWIEHSSGYRAQYVRHDGVYCWDEKLSPGMVSSAQSVCTGASAVNAKERYDSSTIFVLSDLVESLTPRGNGDTSTDWRKYLTTYTVDNDSTEQPNVAHDAPTSTQDQDPFCDDASSPPRRNTGLVCSVEAPHNGATKVTTKYQYDVYGQRTQEIRPGNRTYRYSYFTGTTRDLSGTTPAAGWLRSVTDPKDKFVAFGYDAAGNVARTWDRVATAKSGKPQSDYPGSAGSPASSDYTEDLWEKLPVTGATNLSAPWRYAVSHRDQLGTTSTRTVDDNGNPLTITPAGRGTTTNTFDAADNLKTRTDPRSAGVASTASTEVEFFYDDYSRLVTEEAPGGGVTSHVYDAVHRPLATYELRDDTTFAAPGCTTSTSAMIGMPADKRVCAPGGTIGYDGVDRPVSYTTGSGFTGHRTYDGVGRLLTARDPRVVDAFTQYRYDLDGNMTRECAPESVEVGWTDCDSTSSAFAVDLAYSTGGHLLSTTVRRAPSAGGAAETYTTSFEYDVSGNQTDATSPVADRPKATTRYDSLDRAYCRETPRGTGSSWSHVVTQYDAAGNVTLRSRPIDGKCEAEGEAVTASRSTTWTFDAAHRVTSIVDAPDGPSAADGGGSVRTDYEYDDAGNIDKIIEPRAFAPNAPTDATTLFATSMEYDDAGRLAWRSTPRSDSAVASEPALTLPGGGAITGTDDCPASSGLRVCTTAFQYDAAGRLVTQWLPTAGVGSDGVVPTTKATTGDAARYVDFTYTPDGLVATIDAPAPADTNGNGRRAITRRYYDGSGAVVAEGGPRFDPSASVPLDLTTTTYSGDGQIASRTAPAGNPGGTPPATHLEAFGYDANGNPISYTDPSGRTTTQTYYSDGRLESVQTPSSRYGRPTPTTYGYDTADVTTYKYDGAGNVTAIYSPSANEAATPTSPFVDGTLGQRTATVSTYTHDNLLDTTLTPLSSNGVTQRRERYTYDASGRKTAVTVDTGTVDATTYAFTPTSGTESALGFGYYENDRLKTQTGRNGTPVVTTKYDAAGNRTSVAASDNSTADVTATYYLDGLPRTVDSRSRRTSYLYDGAGREVAHDLSRTADAVGDPGTTATRYDDGGFAVELWSEAAAVAGQTGDLGSGKFSRQYDIAGRPLSETAPNGAQSTFTWRNDDTLTSRVVKQSASATTDLARWDYTYDASYNVLSRAFSGTDGGSSVANVTASYTYTPGGRLESFTYGSGATKYVNWDHNGNRTCYGEDCDRNGFVGSTGPNKSTFAYRADNSIKSETAGGTTTTYDYEPFGGVSGDRCTQYQYDGLDRLKQVTPRTGVTGCSAQTSTYAYDGLDRQVSQVSGGTTTALHYVGFGTAPDRTVKGTSVVDFALDAAGQAVGVEDGSTTQYLVDNGQGSIGAVLSSTAAVVCQTAYDAFGATVGAAGATATWTCGANGATPNDRWFNGGRRDNATGNYQLGSRTYDPAKASFLTPDAVHTGGPAADTTIGFDPLTSNRYSYVNGDPVNYTDPTGHVRGDDAGPLSDRALEHMCTQVERKYATSEEQADRVEKGCLLQFGFPLNAGGNIGGLLRAGIGFIPVVGDLVDLYDCVGGLFSSDRDLVDVALSCGAAIPVAGSLANGVKAVRVLDKASDVATASRVVDGLDDANDGGRALNAISGGGKVASDPVETARRAHKVSKKGGGGPGKGGPGKAGGPGKGSAGKGSGGKRWQVGDAIDAPTAAGNAPAWSTVRGRHWKNRAAEDGAIDTFGPANIERMRKGKAPLHEEVPVSKELDHITPRRDGGGHDIENLRELWPWEHDYWDDYRHYTGDVPDGWTR